MSHYVLKASADPDDDLYALYSDNTDAVLTVGTREAMRRYLFDIAEYPLERARVDARLDHADDHGSSCHIPGGIAGGVLYGWDDEEIIIMEGPGGPGDLPRHDLRAYCLAIRDGDEAAAAAYVRPAEE